MLVDQVPHIPVECPVHMERSSFLASFLSSSCGLGNPERAIVDIRMAADSTMLRMVNLLMALSLGVHREQLEQRTGLTWPRPFLLRPL